MALADLLTESKIFKNRELFSPYFVPKKLIFRDNEIDRIEKSIAPSLNGQRGRNLFIYGKTGSGKTSCVKYVIDEIKNRGVKSLVDELRNFENEDTAMQVLKRLKRHDDATAVYIEF